MSEVKRYIIQPATGGDVHVIVHSFGIRALAVFTTEEKAQEYIRTSANQRDKAPEEMARAVVLLSDRQFRDLLSAKLYQNVHHFWEDPPFDSTWLDYVPDGIHLIVGYLQKIEGNKGVGSLCS